MTENFKKHLNLNIYQIYPRSFYDTNNDGIGDIKGVISKLDYLHDLGVNAIWLCPCYKSPNEDNGYDVADYCDIMDEFGTFDDIKLLISEMKKRGMKLIMDLVPNHTSSQHKWFQESRQSKDNPYSDYYYWFDECPNDWESVFGGSAWEYDDNRQQYYLHSYAKGQPDLNWENPKVIKEMQDIVDFWIDLGVDGFRIDVIDQISKDWENGNNYFGPHLHEYINALFGREKCKNIFTVGECRCDDIEEICRHCKEERKELVTLFQFEHLEAGREDKWDAKIYDENKLKNLRNILNKWQIRTNENDIIYSLFTDNHDNSYFLSRACDDKALRYESATMLAAMFYLLKGVAFIYQGQEFGAVSSRYDKIEEFRDVETINYYNMNIDKNGENHDALMDKINFGSRDNARHPIAWNKEKYSGFSTVEPWILPATRSVEINLENDIESEKSIFKFYKKLLSLRNSSDTIRYGNYKMLNSDSDDFFVYERELDGEKYIIICNFEKESEITVPDGKLVLSNYNDALCDDKKFRPYEIAVYKI